MGFRLSWIGASGVESAQVLRSLDLVETGAIAYYPNQALCYAVLPSGWTILLGPEEFLTTAMLEAASATGRAIGCSASTVVMFSEAYGYESGNRLWRVSHDSERGVDHLEIEGAPPAELAAIRNRLSKLQIEDEEGDVDFIFDAPLELSKAICGFRADEPFPPETVFKFLEPALSGKAGRRQVDTRLQYEALAMRVQSELYPLARELGFVPAVDEPDFLKNRFPSGAAHVMVRSRDGWWEDLQFLLGVMPSGEPLVEIHFFRRQGDARGRGRNGLARPSHLKVKLLDRLFGPKPQPETLDSLMPKMREVLLDIDRYLREGIESETIIPPEYAED